MATNTNKLTLQAITDMARSVQTYVTGQLYFSGLHDTPDGYQDGYFLKSSTTGIEYSQVVENVTELPAEIIDGQLLSLECELYVGCNGEWKSLGSPAAPETETLPGCVTNLSEAVEYDEYRQTFLANNISDNFTNGFLGNDDSSDLIYDVCLFSNSTQSKVKIDETTYKWGMFADTKTVNITATPGTASDRKIEFNYWAGDGAVFGDANNPQTTLVVDKDLSVTGYFSEILEAACEDVALHIQSSTVDGDKIFDDISDNDHTITTHGDVQHSTTNTHLGTTIMKFDGAGDYLQVGDTTTFKFLHDASTDYTIEGWFYLDSSIPTNTKLYRLIGNVINGSRDVAFDLWYNQGWLGYYIHRGVVSTVHRGVAAPPGAFVEDQWNHVAAVYTINNQPKIYVNGQDTNAPTTTDYPSPVGSAATTSNSTSRVTIGAVAGGGFGETYYWPGYMQDIRITKKAIYNGNFTPPTRLLGNPCDEDFLKSYTCPAVALHIQSDTTDGSFIFTDLSGNNTVIPSSVSVDGLTRTPSHTTDQPYLGATSIDFTDNGTRLIVGDIDTKANFQFLHDRTSIYTIEGWMYRNDNSGSSDTILSNAAFTANIGIRLAFLSENNLAFTICNNGSKSFEATTANAIPKNTWVHYAICWDGANITCYINGSSSAGFTQSWTNPVSTSEPTQILWIGARESSSRDRFDGYMQDVRISKKVIYSGDFTPPTSLLGNLCDEDFADSDGDGVADNSDYFYDNASYTQTKSDLDAYVDDQYRAPTVGDIIKWIFSDEGAFTNGEYYILSSVTGGIFARHQGSDYGLNEGFRGVKWIVVNPSDQITPDPNRNAYTCAEAALHIQSDTVNNNLTHTDLTGNNTVTASSVSSPANTTDQPYIGATSIDFTDNGDRLIVGDIDTKANFQFLHDRTSMYTIEGWMYRNDDSNSSDTIFSNAAFTVDVGIRVRFASGDKLGFTICRGSTSKSFEAFTANAIPKNVWVHYAICWDGSNITCYINGSSSAGFTQSWTNPVSTSEPTQILWIGARDASSRDRFDGYMQDIRISKKAIYSGDFTPPTSLLGSPC